MKENKNKIWDVIIIGGGASGMMAGSIAGSRSKSVLILDKNKSLGEKLKITGGGRCNITNAEPDIHKMLKVYGNGAPFLYTPFSIFGVKDTFQYFESRGLPLVTQARNRVFPVTEKALDVFNLLQKDLEKNHVTVKSNCAVKSIRVNNGLVECVETSSGMYYAKSFVLATGGLSHPETGSTGDGFSWLKDLGHEVKTPSPDIVPLAVSDAWVKTLAGVSLSFMKITFFLEGKKQFSKTGKILFTHFGLSGPLILNSSRKVSDLLQSGLVRAYIDVFPDTNEGSLEDFIIKTFDANKNKILRTVFKDIAPEGTAKAIEMICSELDFNMKIHSITKEDRKKIVRLLKALPMTITNLMGYERSVVADGGVSLTEIDMKTMSSKIIPNLYVTGDLLNINRNSGGYSLQICWTTGYIAGNSV
ncbi:MAG: HI0933 family protein [Candidatus Nomurabacteria bacterium GW2011_GWF2_35_66]|uniref:HI0933 family protein n=1 Tax=Candidatus Nomurabacteria bacterium GW2011_GWE1_35_16 TaxID=1618761 RepID=A0A0G0BAF5_9BACT|nr:MAG: HI0933 family protein [Candidatus Nomurabacteria bacterium GW2011_GWF1_34_20]KKP62994.1 MAG: HI0933 family protein [Candidatus Nomurabacteria bacterium GW2011_GWE2_34_25]KKP66398.1 MAG: HI0933 family protein [Candidatus Nomurabacteria bacterium GW2011_GWE1_35_16]KKP83162.1 MAG: HI0933 family protein [Candidatus Nomurabacteria bacterium GW2011_GWF2_35_66]HAE36510.1 aminoacetone oxidase family FAD-binding enzyme [Candidatus Nomurabacteria bacterium]